MSTFLKEIHEEEDNLHNIQRHLNELANAFEIVGNDTMCTTLHDISMRVYYCRKNISKAVTDDLDRTLNIQQKGAGELLSTLCDMGAMKKVEETS